LAGSWVYLPSKFSKTSSRASGIINLHTPQGINPLQRRPEMYTEEEAGKKFPYPSRHQFPSKTLKNRG